MARFSWTRRREAERVALFALVFIAAVYWHTSSACADDLHVATLSGGSWAAAVATLAASLTGTTELVATIVLDAADPAAAQRALRERAAAACADAITDVTIVPAQGEVHVTAIAIRHL